MEQINDFESSSQAHQDKFAWLMTDRKEDGIFLDVGCNDPVKHSNTYSLELLGWRGLLVDIQSIPALASRRAEFIIADAVTTGWQDIFDIYLPNKTIDYLSLDCDESTTKALCSLVKIGRPFSVITIEHDCYRLGPANRETQRTILKALGYELICSDVCIPPGPGIPGQGGPFEDWWVWPPRVNMATAEQLRCDGRLHSEIM